MNCDDFLMDLRPDNRILSTSYSPQRKETHFTLNAATQCVNTNNLHMGRARYGVLGGRLGPVCVRSRVSQWREQALRPASGEGLKDRDRRGREVSRRR